MTREELTECVRYSFNAYKRGVLESSPESIFERAYDIAKVCSIKDYLIESSSWLVYELIKYCDEFVLNELCEFECNYDTPQWGTWDRIEDMIKDYLWEVHEVAVNM